MSRHLKFFQLIFLSSFFSYGACFSEESGQGKESPNDTGVRDGSVEPDSKQEVKEVDAAAPIPNEVHRFIVVGDTGTGDRRQHAVADAMEEKCNTNGCEFVILLGDNFYETGVDSIEDPLWQSHFEEPYRNINVPFYAILGNHDIGLSGNNHYRGEVQVEYTSVSNKWKMPATNYVLKIGVLGFMMMDTHAILRNKDNLITQSAWYTEKRVELDGSDWVFIAGHHPFLSNGQHGNAGSYEGSDPSESSGKTGRRLKEFFDNTVCGTVDVSFSGHDHNRQWINEPDALCGASVIVSGAGARLKNFTDPDRNNVLFADDTKVGFAYVVTDGNTMTLQFIGADGVVDYEHTVVK